MCDTLADRLLLAKLRLRNIKYYNDLARKPSQLKFLRGWINRALE